jgi:hypothetical protein
MSTEHDRDPGVAADACQVSEATNDPTTMRTVHELEPIACRH